jgi:hypothetical protein
MLATSHRKSSVRLALFNAGEAELPHDIVDAVTENWMTDVLGASEEQDAILTHLRDMIVSSLSGYQEIFELAPTDHIRTFAEVVGRQRSAQQHALYEHIEHLNSEPDRQDRESLSALRSTWRRAIWCLEQRDYEGFAGRLEVAEELLEEAFLSASESLQDSSLAADLRDYAVMVCGARTICEELPDELSDGDDLEPTDLEGHPSES